MPTYIDQLHRSILIPQTPQRIICLVPSITELLYDLGMGEYLVGRTKFCVHPKESVTKIQVVGGTKNIHFDRIEALQPDLIIANKEENDREQIETLAKKHTVWVSDVPHFEASLEMIRCLGQVLNQEATGQVIVEKLRQRLALIKAHFKQKHGLATQQRVAYLIWQNPYMSIGRDTYIHDLLQRLDYENVFAHTSRYPSFTLHELQTLEPEALFLSSEPYPFKNKHITTLREYFPHIPIILVDGELFSWYGTRLLHLAGE